MTYKIYPQNKTKKISSQMLPLYFNEQWMRHNKLWSQDERPGAVFYNNANLDFKYFLDFK